MNLQTDVGKATVKQVCEVFSLSRQAYYAAKRPARDVVTAKREPKATPKEPAWASAASVLAAILVIVESHAAWGVRKVWATLRRAPYSLLVSRKRVYALMKAHGLTLAPDAPRVVEQRRGQVAVEEPNRLWATDLTTVFTQQNGTVAVVPVIDCGCRSVLALEVTKSQEAPAVLAAVRHALAEEFGDARGVPHGLDLRTDHGPQYTGSDCESLCTDWGITQSMAPVGRPTGNAVAERLIRTMKEECIWLRDWNSLAELRAALLDWLSEYNERRPHQSLEWSTPSERRAERLVEVRAAA